MTVPVFDDPVSKQPSVSFTLVVITFTVVMVRWLIGGQSFHGHTFDDISTTEIDAWLTPVFFLYFGRGLTKAGEAVAIAKAGGKSDG